MLGIVNLALVGIDDDHFTGWEPTRSDESPTRVHC